MRNGLRILPFGDSALLVELADEAGTEVGWRVQGLADALRQVAVAVVPGQTSVLVRIDPGAESKRLEDQIRRVVAGLRRPEDGERRVRTIPVVYGGEAGPDLGEVSAATGLSEAEVVRLHSGAELSVELIGFAPGFAYLGELPEVLRLPRRGTPRRRVEAGSVAIAGRQTGLYPGASPGGWHVIGRTPMTLFDARREPPAYLASGDRVRFEAIAEVDAERYRGARPDW